MDGVNELDENSKISNLLDPDAKKQTFGRKSQNCPNLRDENDILLIVSCNSLKMYRLSLVHPLLPCNASDVLSDLVGALKPLAHKQQRIVEACEIPELLEVAVEEPALRQALSNLIEGALLRTNVGGMVEIVSTSAPAGGVLIIIDDDGPDMHYMVC
ncbi:putative histidine kinase/HSP90-like ATPase superfamily [Helianthus anomalus]